ncbi:hypothetical protein A1359_13790 [Methylomonas lenta]|uniref:Uncharacterized protein n=1 Tax=Methylomonas lenta TaxID=980561 RepID=A0A177N4S2_9GAMM|nr:hypothetical protein [Methylomonas lenta]OAI12604.1 hypothetical protein A1359_13790 [Methylomonas lenta]
MNTQATDEIRPIISYSDESVKLNASISGISGIYHRLIEQSAIDNCLHHNLLVCLESHAEDLINVCNAIDKLSGDHAATIKFNGKNRRIKTYGGAAVQLNKSISSINSIFHLLIENSFKGIPAKFDLIVCLKHEAEQLVNVCKTMLEQAEAVKPVQNKPATIYLVPSAGGVENRPKTMTFGGYMKRQADEMGLQPIPLEADLLIQRIRAGGHSGQFLADAFLSAYRKNHPFKHALFELINLDAEGFRLFHQILHIRHVPGWDDDELYRVEQAIVSIVGGGQ